MPAVIRNLPFFDRSTTVEVSGRPVPIKHDLIVVWVSISEAGIDQLHPTAPRFPAVLDTGCNHSFVMRERHLIEWGGIHPDYLRRLRSIRIYGSLVPQMAANVWLHPNRAGHRDDFSGQPLFLIESEPGIAVVPKAVGDGNPRLPLLGLRALRWNRLHLAIDGDRRRVNIRTRRRFWLSR